MVDDVVWCGVVRYGVVWCVVYLWREQGRHQWLRLALTLHHLVFVNTGAVVVMVVLVLTSNG